MDSILKQMKPLHILGSVLAFFVAIWILRCIVGWFSFDYFIGIGGNTYSTDCKTGCLIQNGTLLTVLETAAVVLANNFRLNADGSYLSQTGTIIARVPFNCKCGSLDSGKWTSGTINTDVTRPVVCTGRTGVTITDLTAVIDPEAFATAIAAAAAATLAAAEKAVTDATTANTAAQTAKTTADTAAAAAVTDAAAKKELSDSATAAAIAEI